MMLGLCLIAYKGLAESEANDWDWSRQFQFAVTNAGTGGESAKVPWRVGTNAGGEVHVAQVFAANLFGLGTNLGFPFFSNTNQTASLSPRAFPSRGVYLSRPHTLLVIVPDGSIDSKMVIGPNGGMDLKMPMIEPNDELVPWPEARTNASSKIN